MIKDLVKNYLKEEPQFRERKNKDRGLVNLLIDKYNLHRAVDNDPISKELLIELFQDFSSMDRLWRQILAKHPELRGADYNDKEKLESEKQVDLGYQVQVHDHPKGFESFEKRTNQQKLI